LLRGDFDIQVDFSLLDWPSVEQLGTGNGVRMGLAVGEGENWWSVQREGYGSLTFDFPGYPREVYACDFAGSVQGITPTDDMSGKLRLVRSGNTLTGYYFSLGSWVIVASGWVTTGDVSFTPTAWSHDYAFMDNNVLLAFDNFIVNSGLLICEGRIIVPIDIKPDTLNLKGMGKWITAYIELPEGYDVASINVSSIMLNDTIPAEPRPVTIGDYDNDTIPDLMVKFDRDEVISYILANADMTQLIEKRFMIVTLTITGNLNDGTQFQGSDTIKIIYKPKYMAI